MTRFCLYLLACALGAWFASMFAWISIAALFGY